MSSPVVSVICPTFNRSSAIVSTIESVTNQSESDFELVVVLDGCTDDTLEHVSRIERMDRRVRSIPVRRFGHPSGPRNVGLTEARGEYVAYIDHDDQWTSDHLSVLKELFSSGESMVSTSHERVFEDGSVDRPLNPLMLCWHPEIQTVAPLFQPTTVGHRRGVVEDVGGWRDGPGLEDWDLWFRMTEAGHRFRTSLAVTARIFHGMSSRRYRVQRPHRLPLAVFDSPVHVREALESLRMVASSREFSDARFQDSIDWFSRLEDEKDFVKPNGWPEERTVSEMARETLANEPAVWPADMVAVPFQSKFAVAVNLWCSSEEHASRIIELNAKCNRRQMAMIALDSDRFRPVWSVGNLLAGQGKTEEILK